MNAEEVAPLAENTRSTGKRVFLAEFMHETNTFHPLPTTSFRSYCPKTELKALAGTDVTIVRGIGATPQGGGTVQAQPCREAIARIVESLRDHLPVDGVFLRLHGAMFAEEVGPAETILVEEVRRLVGRKVPIACSLDLHGNIPARLGEAGDIFVGFKTAPHIDVQETVEHAGRLLLETLRGKINPVSFVMPIPILMQGEKAMTTSEPFRSLVNEARRLERESLPGHQAKILAATLFVGCYVTDSPDTGMAVLVTADGSHAAARAAATRLARLVWDARSQFHYGCETAELDEGVTRAMAAKESTVFLTDSGDNVTAGAPGDMSLVLRRLVDRNAVNAVVAGIYDATAARKCFEAGEGKRLTLSIGETVEKRRGLPLQAEAEVVRLIEKMRPRTAVIRIGGILVALQEDVYAFTTPERFHDCGIEPLKHKIVVVKQGYLYPKLSAVAPRHIMLLTPGPSDLRIEKLKYIRLRRPIYPLELGTRFEPS